jgi:hypothetical protein
MDDFATVDGVMAEDYVEMEIRAASRWEANLNPPTLAVKLIATFDLYAHVSVETNSVLNVMNVLKSENQRARCRGRGGVRTGRAGETKGRPGRKVRRVAQGNSRREHQCRQFDTAAGNHHRRGGVVQCLRPVQRPFPATAGQRVIG